MFISWILLITLVGIYANNVVSFTTKQGLTCSSTFKSQSSKRDFSLQIDSTPVNGSSPRKQKVRSAPGSDLVQQNEVTQGSLSQSTETNIDPLDHAEAEIVRNPSAVHDVTKRETSLITSTANSETTTELNTWFVSDDGSDENACRTESAPCKNLQTVLDRAADGADIYVTSGTLSLGLVTGEVSNWYWIENHSCCIVRSNISFSIGSLKGSDVRIYCSEYRMHWILSDNLCASQGIPWMRVSNMIFNVGKNYFTLYGLASFVNCKFKFTRIVLPKTRCDNTVSKETFRSLISYAEIHQVTITRSQTLSYRFDISLVDVVREIDIIESEMRHLHVEVGCQSSSRYGSCAAVAVIICDGSNLYYIKIDVRSSSSFGLLQCRNSILNGHCKTSGQLYAHFINCIFIGQLYMRDVLYLYITDCKFNILDIFFCEASCAINVQTKFTDSEAWHLAWLLFCPIVTCGLPKPRVEPGSWYQSRIYIESSVFVGSAGKTFGSVTVKGADLTITNCIFTFTPDSIPAPVGAFLYLDGKYLEANNITFDATAIMPTESKISIMSVTGYIKHHLRVHISCPTSFYVVQKRSGSGLPDYLCKEACGQNAYSFQSGASFIEGRTHSYGKVLSLRVNNTDPDCISCPVGANCTEVIHSLPGYWGFKDSNRSVKMIRCPKGYCCTNSKMCKGINSCNTRRTGVLCGICEKNHTESLFSPDCKVFELCYMSLIIGLYVLCVIVYALVLMFIGHIKDKVTALLKIMYQTLKRKQTYLVSKRQDQKLTQVDKTSGSKDKEKEKESSSDEGMKYMQILLYYVQDASLYKVTLPNDGQQTESSIVKILQFSPEILTTVYTKISDLCFTYGTTAVTKILAKSIFGPCVILFLFLVYLGQWVLSQFAFKGSKMWKSLESCLVRAFLLAILFSYQQIMVGVFSLVQCIEIEGNKVLYVQGEIECYTWWQIIIKMYICLNIIPGLIILSHVSFYIRDKKW